MIKSIRLLNWRSHEDTSLEFHKGTNLLVGIMGSGKSSILEAISFALFGTFPALERRKLKTENVIRLNEKNAKLILEFLWASSNYRIERTLERSRRGISSNAEIFKDNALVEHGTKAVNSYIENLTSLDYDLFTRAIYSEQNNIDYFLNLDPRRRKQEIDTLLGLDKFEIARANTVTVIGRIRSKKQAIAERFDKEKLLQLVEKEKAKAQVVSSTKSKIAEIKLVYEKQQKEAQLFSTQFDAMKKDRELFLSLEKEVIHLSAQVDSLKKEIKESSYDESAFEAAKKKLSAVLDERSKIQTTVKSLDVENARFSKEVGTVEASLRTSMDAKKRFEALKKELLELLDGHSEEDFSIQQKKLEEAALAAESERIALKSEVVELKELIGRLKPGLSKCPLCSYELTEECINNLKVEKKSLIKAKSAKISELAKLAIVKKKESTSLAAKLQKSSVTKERLASLESDLKKADGLSPKKVELEKKLVEINSKKQTLQKSFEHLSSDVEALRVEINNSENMLRKRKLLEGSEKKLTDLKVKLTTVKFDEKSFEEVRGKLEQARIATHQSLSQKQSLETEFRVSSDMLKLVRDDLLQMRKMEKDLNELYNLEEQLLIYKNALLETQTSLRQGLSDAINNAMNEIWSIFYPYKNYRALRLCVTEKDYIFEVTTGQEWKGLETIASGGERASAALTLRVALAMVLTPKLSWLILDEPTHNLDTDAVELLSSALQFKVPQVVNQTFVITHDEAFMGSDFASSYRLNRDKEHNGATKVEIM